MTRRITQAEFARMMNVNRSTVRRWVLNGRITLGADKRLDPDAAKQQLELTESAAPHHQARKAQIEAEKKAKRRQQAEQPKDAEEQPPADAADVALRLKLAMTREREAKAAMAEMEQARKAGELVRREDVDFVLSDFGATLRQLLEGMADRLAGELAGHGGDTVSIHASLEQTARDMLEEMSAHMARKRAKLGGGQ
ncbi:MAG TPA: hypothetical protein ENI94_12945 [Gammaproteobacteria bacterium]|nr:hypothetical protein [Gammaproteobacteria bacterium]